MAFPVPGATKLLVGLQSLIKPVTIGIRPFWLGVEITNRCNSRCRTCPLPNYAPAMGPSEDLTLSGFREIFDRTQPGILSLTGLGENLLNRDYFRMVAYACEKGATVYSTTNGILLSDHADDVIASGIHELVVSLDGYDSVSYSKIRGVDRFERVTQSIRHLIAVRDRKGSGLLVGMNVVVQDLNYRQLSRFVGIAHSLGVGIINFLPLDIHGDFHSNMSYAEGIERDPLKQSIQEAGAAARQLKIATNLSFWKRHFEDIWRKLNIRPGAEITRKACLHPWAAPFITSKGHLLPCCILVPEKISYGNVFENDYLSVLNSEAALDFRKRIKTGEKPFKECRECIVSSLSEIGLDMIRRSLF